MARVFVSHAGDDLGWAEEVRGTAGPVLPGRDPVGALARELARAARRAELAWTVSDVHARLDGAGLGPVVDDILVAAPGPPRRLLLVVDQFEELLTQAPAAECARFVALLRPALAGSVQVVATLRSEFLDPLPVDPALADLPQHTHVLQPLRRDALRTVVEGPARLAGIEVDDELVARLVDDTGGGDALPLLAFTLAELADGVERGGRLLARRYEQLGGVQGALARQADAALDDAVRAGGRRPDEVVTQLLRLVTVDEQGRPTRWRTRRAEMSDTAVTELDAFVARRLLTSDSNGGGVVISVAHEAFLSAWPPLATAIAEASTALRARRGVEQAADAWADSGRPAERLWDGGHLAAALADTGAREEREARTRLATDRVELTERAREFLHRSMRRDRRRRRRVTTILSVLLAVALVGALVAVRGQQMANEQRKVAGEQQRIAVARQLVTQAEAVRDSDQRLAVQLALAARAIHDGAETRSSLAATVTGARAVTYVPGGVTFPGALAFAPGRNLLAVGDEDVRLWDLTNPADVAEPVVLGDGGADGDFDSIGDLDFSADGRLLATVGTAPHLDDPLGIRTLTVWDVDRPQEPLVRPVRVSDGDEVLVTVVGDGQTVAVAESGSVSLWDIRNPAAPTRHPKPITIDTWAGSAQRGVAGLVAVGDSTLAVAGTDGWVAFYQVIEPGQPVLVGEIPGDDQITSGVSVAVTTDRSTLALARGDLPVTLWDITQPQQPHEIGTGIPGGGGLVAFAPDGNTLATADDSVLLWDVSTKDQPRRIGRPLTGGAPQALAFVADGAALVAADMFSVSVWNVLGPGHPHEAAAWPDGPQGTPGTMALAVAPSGGTVATAGDGTVGFRDMAGPAAQTPAGSTLRGRPPLAFVDAHTLAVASADADRPSVQFWDLTDVAGPRQVGPPYPHPGKDWVMSFALSPTGQILVTGGMQHDVRLWEVASDPVGLSQHRELTEPLRISEPFVRALAFNPDGRMLAATGGSGLIGLWSLADPQNPETLGAVEANRTSAMVFADEGRTLLLAGPDTALAVWDVTDPTEPRRASGPPPGGGHERVAFSRDGGLLATADSDGGVMLWDLTDRTQPRQLGPVLQDGETVGAVAFSADGLTLATATSTGTTRLWDLRDLHDVRRDAVQHACAIAGTLAPDEWARYVSGLAYVDACAP